MIEQIDIAPTIAEMLKIPFQADGKPISEIVEYGKKCIKIILLIIDSLGYSQYLNWLNFFNSTIKNGKVYKCKINADKTTPAIASILSGKNLKTIKYIKQKMFIKANLNL